MGEQLATAEERFAAVVAALRDEPNVTADAPGQKRFGSSTLQVGGKIFAMLVDGRLVVKLPRPRVDALIAAGAGQRFDPGHGRLMKEWLTVDPAGEEGWLPLAREAREFVASRG